MNPLRQAILRHASRRFGTTPLAIISNTSPSTPTAITPHARRWQSSSSSSNFPHHPGGPIDPVAQGEMGVGELEGASFKIEPLRRTGEDAETMRARLTCMSPYPPLPSPPPPPTNHLTNKQH